MCAFDRKKVRAREKERVCEEREERKCEIDIETQRKKKAIDR
jgi:hypothetical protein